MLKKLLELFIAASLIIVLLRYGRKSAAKCMILVLPVSFGTEWGPINTFIITLLAAGEYLVSFIMKKKAGVSSFTVKIFLSLFLILNVLSLLINVDYLDFTGPALSSPHSTAILNIVSCILLFLFIVRSIQTEDDIVSFMTLALFAYLISSVLSILQLINPAALLVAQDYFSRLSVDTEDRGVRVMGTIGSFELYAEYSGIMTLVSLFLGMTEKAKLRKAFWLGTCLYCIFLMLMTKSRGGVISLGAAMLYLLTIQSKTIGAKRTLALLFAGIGSLAIVSIVTSGSGYSVMDALLSKTEIKASQGQFDSRSEVWAYGFSAISEMQFPQTIVGKGPGLISGTSLLEVFPHSLYIYLLISLGYLGLCLYLAWFLWLAAPKIRQNALTQKQVLLRVILKTILILIVVDQAKIEYIRPTDSSYAQILWMFYALMYVAIHKRAKITNYKLAHS
ncbi:MAG: O-antigen ligase family protein [Methylococcaceae bacterium]|nr:O-antigen ligase family protein [Methylococcaceae bacterium]